MSEELVLKIKDALDITFSDEDYDRKIVGIIEDAIPVLRSLFGVEDSEVIDEAMNLGDIDATAPEV